eukprot:Selendium_serpulae@DN10104_c0_g1_i1.p1
MIDEAIEASRLSSKPQAEDSSVKMADHPPLEQTKMGCTQSQDEAVLGGLRRTITVPVVSRNPEVEWSRTMHVDPIINAILTRYQNSPDWQQLPRTYAAHPRNNDVTQMRRIRWRDCPQCQRTHLFGANRDGPPRDQPRPANFATDCPAAAPIIGADTDGWPYPPEPHTFTD